MLLLRTATTLLIQCNRRMPAIRSFRRFYTHKSKPPQQQPAANPYGCYLPVFVSRQTTVSLLSSFVRRLASDAAKTGPTATTKPTRSDFRRLLSLARKEKWIMLAAVGCLIVSSSITMSVPFAIGKMLDLITANNFSRETIFNFCAILGGIFVIGAFANFGRVYLINGASK